MLPPGLLRFDTPPARLRAVAFLEGVSYLLLLFVAMPLKYFADAPLAVRITGSVHGFLFVWLVVLTLLALHRRTLPFPFAVRIAIASLIPFATFTLDAALRKADDAHRQLEPG